MQLLFDGSDESPDARGLGAPARPGAPASPTAPGLKIPHMGWNQTRRGPAGAAGPGRRRRRRRLLLLRAQLLPCPGAPRGRRAHQPARRRLLRGGRPGQRVRLPVPPREEPGGGPRAAARFVFARNCIRSAVARHPDAGIPRDRSDGRRRRAPGAGARARAPRSTTARRGRWRRGSRPPARAPPRRRSGRGLHARHRPAQGQPRDDRAHRGGGRHRRRGGRRRALARRLRGAVRRGRRGWRCWGRRRSRTRRWSRRRARAGRRGSWSRSTRARARSSVEGWTEATGADAVDSALAVARAGAAAVLYTDIARDGMRGGPNLDATGAARAPPAAHAR